MTIMYFLREQALPVAGAVILLKDIHFYCVLIIIDLIFGHRGQVGTSL